MAGELFISDLAGGFDYNEILQNVQLLKSRQIAFLQQREDMLSQKKSAISDFGDIVSEFRNIFDDLSGGDLSYEKQITVSNEDVIEASITNKYKAVPANIDITVNQLAKNDVWLSQTGVSDKDTSAVATSNGTLEITYGGNVVATIDYDTDASDSTKPSTLQEIADAINSAQDDVNASIFFDGTNYKLILSGNDTGANNTISLNETGGGDLLTQLQLGSGYSGSHVQTAQNAQIEIYGQTVESQTNTFTDVLEGVSLTVKQTTSTPVNIQISQDKTAIKDKLKEFVDKYNEMVDFISTNTGENGVLSGEHALQSIRGSIFSSLDPLFQLGIFSVDHKTGHLSLKETEVDNILNNDPQIIQDKLNDVKATLDPYLKAVLDTDGIINQKEKSYERQINNIQEKIEFDTKRINQEIESMKKQFVALQKYMAELEDIRTRIQSTFGIQSIPGQ
jgi:flagellar hook-associated protein 2